MRLFVSLNFTEEVNRYFLELQDKVMAISGASLSRASEFHLTLKFLGWVKDERKSEIIEFLSAFKKPGILDCSLEKIGVFKKGIFPSVIWVGLHVPDLLLKWQEEFEKGFMSFGFEPEYRFMPHITLARVKFCNDVKFADKIFRIKINPMSFRFDKFYLMQSHLSRGGARYEVLQEFPLV